MQLSKAGLDSVLDADVELRTVFYQQMAINVTQRLQRVSKATADIREVNAACGFTSIAHAPQLAARVCLVPSVWVSGTKPVDASCSGEGG